MLRDREHGGRLLARALGYVRAEEPIILGVPRGGVPVAFEVARELDAPLALMTVQKVGVAEFPEYTIAAVAEGGAVHVRRDALREAGMTEADALELAKEAAAELVHRVRAYRGDAPPPDLAGRTVVLVDDGVATGTTAFAAARAVRSRGATRIVLAAPVIAAATVPELRRVFDDMVALDWPRPFVGVGIWYDRFDPVSDEDVMECMRLGREQLPRHEADRIWNGEFPRGVAGESSTSSATQVLAIPCKDALPGSLEADLVLPIGANGIVVFSTGSTRESPRYRLISRALHRVGIGTLRCDLLTLTERRATRLPVDPKVLTTRIALVTRWISSYPATRGIHRGLYGASAGAEAALVAVARDPDLVDAVVVRAGQLDAVPTLTLAGVRAPVLLVVGSRDENVLSVNRAALSHLATADLVVVPGATDLFGEPGALETVARLAADWFKRWLERAVALGPARALNVTEEAAVPSLSH